MAPPDPRRRHLHPSFGTLCGFHGTAAGYDRGAEPAGAGRSLSGLCSRARGRGGHRSICGYIETTVRQIGAMGSSLHDIAQILRQRVCLAADDRPAKILSYGGRAPLEAWLAAVAQRTALSLYRTDGAQHRMQQRLAAEAAIASQNPELQIIKAQYENEFKEALRLALEDLSDRSRTLLRLHVFGGQTLDQLAVIYDVHDTTISRWLAKAQKEMLERTAHHMHHQYGVSVNEFPSLVRVMASQIDVSIARLLDDDRTPSPEPGK